VTTMASIREMSRSIAGGAFRFLRRLDEGLHTTEVDLLAARVERLEQEVMRLKAQPDHLSKGRM